MCRADIISVLSVVEGYNLRSFMEICLLGLKRLLIYVGSYIDCENIQIIKYYAIVIKFKYAA